MQMHIGHSHDHYHNHLSNPNPAPSEFLSQLRNPKNYLKHPRGRAILIASTVLLLSCAVRKRIAKIDVIIFSLFATSLSAFDIFKSGAKMWISRMQLLREGIAKHSTPINSNYLFKNRNLADRVTLLGVGINVVLSISKFLGGLGEPIYFVITRSLLTLHTFLLLAFNSAVLVADAGHSLSDLFSDFITLWAVQVARLPADNDHPYGYVSWLNLV